MASMGNTADRQQAAILAELADLIKVSELGSVRAVAGALGMDYYTFRRWVKGEQEMRLSTLIATLEVIGVPFTELLQRAEARAQQEAGTG